MKYIRNHREFANNINSTYNLDMSVSKIDEAFQNDVTLSNSLIGQLFGWIIRKIGGSIKKGQMKTLLGELAIEFGKGQYSAVRNKSISKKIAVYSGIIELKNIANNDNLSDEDFSKKFTSRLEDILKEYKDLIQGDDSIRIDDSELMYITKEFYKKLNKISSNPTKLEPEISSDEESIENSDEESNIGNINLDESLSPNDNLLEMLNFAGDNILDVISSNIEHQLNKDVITGNNLIRIKESSLSFDEVDNYFKALNMSIELINGTIIIDNYDRYSLLMESRDKKSFIVGLSDYINYILTRPIVFENGKSTLVAVGMKTEKDFEEKAESIYNVLKKINNNNTLVGDIEEAKGLGNDKLVSLLRNANSLLENVLDSSSDSSGFRNSFNKLKNVLVGLKNLLISEMDNLNIDNKEEGENSDGDADVDSGKDKTIDTEELSKKRDYAKFILDKLFPDDKLYESEVKLSNRDKKDLLGNIRDKAKEDSTFIRPIQVMKIFNKAHYKYTVDNYDNIPDGKQGSSLQGKGKGVNKKKNYKKMPDGSGRHVALFNQWNEGVLDLLEEYGEYIPDALKKFIISILNDNTLFGKGGAQAKLLQEYFNIKVSNKEFGGAVYNNKESEKSSVYKISKDTSGLFEKSKNDTLQLKKSNFYKAAFILKGEYENVGETALVCYYIGVKNGNILIKYKENNIDFLNNYKEKVQTIKDQKFEGVGDDVVRYGIIKNPDNGKSELKVDDVVPIWSTNVDFSTDVEKNMFKIDSLYYLKGENDGGIMKLENTEPNSDYNDEQVDDIETVFDKFKNK